MLPVEEMDVHLKMLDSKKMGNRLGVPMMPMDRFCDVWMCNCIGWTGDRREPDVLYLDILHNADVCVDGRCEHIPIDIGNRGE